MVNDTLSMGRHVARSLCASRLRRTEIASDGVDKLSTCSDRKPTMFDKSKSSGSFGLSGHERKLRRWSISGSEEAFVGLRPGEGINLLICRCF